MSTPNNNNDQSLVTEAGKRKRIRYKRRLEAPLFKTISVICPKCGIMLPKHDPPHWCYPPLQIKKPTNNTAFGHNAVTFNTNDAGRELVTQGNQ
jgi:hypothetical protein